MYVYVCVRVRVRVCVCVCVYFDENFSINYIIFLYAYVCAGLGLWHINKSLRVQKLVGIFTINVRKIAFGNKE